MQLTSSFMQQPLIARPAYYLCNRRLVWFGFKLVGASLTWEANTDKSFDSFKVEKKTKREMTAKLAACCLCNRDQSVTQSRRALANRLRHPGASFKI